LTEKKGVSDEITEIWRGTNLFAWAKREDSLIDKNNLGGGKGKELENLHVEVKKGLEIHGLSESSKKGEAARGQKKS